MSGRAAYPQYFKTPEGRPISVRRLAKALRQIHKDPGKDYPGWDWFPVPGHFIIREVLRGIHDRINMRGEKNG